jgi:CheY-like chemotaxis protein
MSLWNLPREEGEHLEKPFVLLMADDDEDDCLLMKEALVKLGFQGESQFVHDGEKLLAYLHQSNNGGPPPVLRPDLILVDLVMPRMDGIEVLREIKSYPAFQDIPVVVYTGSKDESKREQCLVGGAARWITKSSTAEAIVEDIRSVLSVYNCTK